MSGPALYGYATSRKCWFRRPTLIGKTSCEKPKSQDYGDRSSWVYSLRIELRLPRFLRLSCDALSRTLRHATWRNISTRICLMHRAAHPEAACLTTSSSSDSTIGSGSSCRSSFCGRMSKIERFSLCPNRSLPSTF
jgi:hypothetical protein